MATNRRNAAPLIFGLILIVAGAILLAWQFLDLDIPWLLILKFVFPILFLLGGGIRLIRHFTWSADEVLSKPSKAGLLGGLFWTSLGLVILLDLLGVVETLNFFGMFWPVLLILFGLGKIVDFYRLESRLQVRAGEIFGLIFIICFGLTASRISKTHFPLLQIDLPGVSGWPVPTDVIQERYRFEQVESMPASGFDSVVLRNRYGDVQVEAGLSDRIEVTLTKVIREESKEKARQLGERLQLSLSSEETRILIDTNRLEIGEEGRKINTHLLARVPASLKLEISNSYGKVEVSGLQASCNVSNSFGETILDSITGSVDVTNKYKGIEVRHVEGSVRISNRQGPVIAQDISGNLMVETAHDRITASRIGGDLEAANRFGTVRLETVAGQVVIVAPGSRVSVSDMKRDVRIENSHQRVSAADISGGLDLQTAYSKVHLSRIQGPVDVQADHSEILAESFHGKAVIEARASEVSLSDLHGPVRIATSLRQVSVEKFDDTLEVRNEFGEIQIETRKPLSSSISATNRNGIIRLTIPAASEFDLAARTKGGTISSDFAAEQLRTTGDSSFLEASIGGGGPAVQLETVYSDIRIRKRG